MTELHPLFGAVRKRPPTRVWRVIITGAVVLNLCPVSAAFARAWDTVRQHATHGSDTEQELVSALLLGPDAARASQDAAVMAPLRHTARAHIQAGHARREAGLAAGTGEWLTLILHGPGAQAPQENLQLIVDHYAAYQASRHAGAAPPLSSAEQVALLKRLEILTARPPITERTALLVHLDAPHAPVAIAESADGRYSLFAKGGRAKDGADGESAHPETVTVTLSAADLTEEGSSKLAAHERANLAASRAQGTPVTVEDETTIAARQAAEEVAIERIGGKESQKKKAWHVYKDGKLIRTYYRREIPRAAFDRFDQVTIRGARLSSHGMLFGRRRRWATFSSYPGAPVEFDMEEGHIVRARILDEQGRVVKTATFSRITQDGKLKDVFYDKMISARLQQLSRATITHFQLDAKGFLRCGGRTWGRFSGYPGAQVEFDVEHGLITTVRILNDQGTVQKTIEFSRIEQEGKLTDVFFQALVPARLGKLNLATIRKYRLNGVGQLILGGRRWVELVDLPNAPIECQVEQGLVTEVRVLDELGGLRKEIKAARIERGQQVEDVFYGSLHSARFRALDQVTIRSFRLDQGGNLQVGGRTWLRSAAHAQAPVEIEVRQGVVTNVNVLDESGRIIETISLGRIERNGKLIEVFHRSIPPTKFRTLDQITVRNVRLTQGGGLNVGGRTWATFTTHSNAPVEFEVQQGLVTSVRVLDEQGHVVETIPLARIEQEGKLIDVFYGGMASSQFAALDRITIRNLRLGKFGNIHLGGKRRACFIPYPEAEIAADVEHGTIAMVRFVRDRHGTPILYQRVGDGFGRTARTLFAREETFRNRLTEGFVAEGIPSDSAQAIADTLVRLRGGSILLLVREGLLSDKDARALADATFDGLDITFVAQKLKHQIAVYRTQELSNDFIDRLLATHLLPWTVVERLQRTYRLGRDFALVRQALHHPNVEEWIKRVREVQEVRGMLDVDKHLRRYTSGQVSLVSLKGEQGLLNDLEAQERVLRQLIETGNTQAKLQLEALEQAINHLKQDHTTSSHLLDCLLGFAPLSPVDPVKESRVKFINPHIAYRKLSDFESVGDQAQATAVRLALNPTEVLFIEGPAGTGKTTVIQEIVRQAIRRGQRVLLVSQMHQAVDNVLEGLLDDLQIPVMRLGNDPSLFRYGTTAIWPGNQDVGVRRGVIEEFDRRRRAGRGYLLASTTMGIATDWVFANHITSPRNMEVFDLVIMDEASRETISGAFVPLRYIKPHGKVILVGDVNQLPPFGLTETERVALHQAGIAEADLASYTTSIFDWLLTASYGDRVMLSTNYRSHPLITGLVSELFYEGDVRRRAWEDFDAQTLSLRVIDLAESPDEFYEERSGTSFLNPHSAKQVVRLLQRYRAQHTPLEMVTIITPYRPQVELIERLVRNAFPQAENWPTITTIDGYQGGENRAVIFDFVRSNPRQQIGFVKDLRRLNVGLSRAQDNLAVIWDSRTFTGQPTSMDTPEDRQARALFQKLEDYYDAEVHAFFPEPEQEENNAVSEADLTPNQPQDEEPPLIGPGDNQAARADPLGGQGADYYQSGSAAVAAVREASPHN